MNAAIGNGGKPEVSVIMPAYNAATTLSQAIESVRSQTFDNWELIIVDDRSGDATFEIAQGYQEQDSRIRVVRGHHKGVSAARNAGIGESRGRILAFLDADDGWHPEKLSSHLAHLARRPGVGISYSQAAFLDENGTPTGKLSRARMRGVEPRHLLCTNPTTTASTLVVRACVFERAGIFNTNMSFAEDLEWLIRASLLSGLKLEGLDLPLTDYRTSPAGLSSRLDAMQAGWEMLVSEVRAYAPALVAAHCDRARAEHLFYLARRALRLRGRELRAREFLSAALCSDPRLILRKPARVLAVYLFAQYSARAGRNQQHTTIPGRT